ncbi:MAG: hypothetical protein ABI881_01490 [Betaproteobacteria bacterium]
MTPFSPRRRDILLGIPALLAGCTGGPFGIVGAAGPPAPAPDIRVGDRWVYHVADGFRTPVEWDETQQVIAAGANGYTVRVTCKGPTVNLVRTEEWASPGVVRTGAAMDIETRRFITPLLRYKYPLTPGTSWSQNVDNFNENTRKEGEFNYYARVGGWKPVTVPAGTFDAIFLNVLMRMDDEEFWRWPTECNYGIWYAPAVGALVEERKEAQYLEKGGMDNAFAIRAQHTRIALLSFARPR